MNILMINQDWFAAEWRAQGHRVVVARKDGNVDVKISNPLTHWHRLCENAPGGHLEPDVIVVHDDSSPIIVTGLEEAIIPTLFYSVDAHHHMHLHRHIYPSFDEVLVAQRDYISGFEEWGYHPQWLPLWASRFVEASEEKKYKASFVGTMDPKLNPDRVRFFEELKKKTDIEVKTGEYWGIFPFSEIVVNQTVKGDLNFRVFETMMCGPCLLTEVSPNGLLDLFEDGKHLVTYKKGDADDAAAKIQELLGDLDRCHRIAKAGRDEIRAKHLSIHRAATVMEILKNLKKRDMPNRNFGMVANFLALAISYNRFDPGLATRVILTALGCAEKGLLRREPIAHDIPSHILLCTLKYDQRVPGRTAFDLLRRFLDTYPNEPVFGLGVVRGYLNAGEKDKALAIAQQMNPQSPEAVFPLAEQFVAQLLERAG